MAENDTNGRSHAPTSTAASTAASTSASTSAPGSNGHAVLPDDHLARTAVEFAHQAEKLSHRTSEDGSLDHVAVEARFVTPQDPVLVTNDGHRLPGVPLPEAHKLNLLKEEMQAERLSPAGLEQKSNGIRPGEEHGEASKAAQTAKRLGAAQNGKAVQRSAEGSLRRAMPPSHTNPLFPPLPLYGPPSLLRNIQCATFRVSSFFLSLAFLGVIVLGSLFTSIPTACNRLFQIATFRDPDRNRPFHEEEVRRKKLRRQMERSWRRRRSQERLHEEDNEDPGSDSEGFMPTEGGPDPIVCDVGYYARRVGLDVEAFEVQTEDGFIIDLWHVYDPKEYTELPEEERGDHGPDLFAAGAAGKRRLKDPNARPKFPVLLMHGLLQSAGAYCVNDDDSLAFYLCKSGYDVWLGNNRCGFRPRHVLLEYSDPRMWCWNIRQMGVFDLPALTSRVLYETGFEKLGLICHSQGTTETFVALAKEQRPDLGEKLTVFCALAPAAYAGPLIGKMYFKFMRVITPAMFRLMFGIHAFIPFMMTMHRSLPPRLYGWLGYKVFSFLFDWTDERWDRGLRDRMFQFSPVYVSAESMRWWLGRECFARHKCILATKEEWRAEEREDNEMDGHSHNGHDAHHLPRQPSAAYHPEKAADPDPASTNGRAVEPHRHKPRGSTAWYDSRAPPFALWVCGRDNLVDGGRLLRRFERGREPHVRVVHSRVLPEFEHLDVIWAMDAPTRVFSELREVLWKTCDVRDVCRVPKGCEDVAPWVPPPPQQYQHHQHPHPQPSDAGGEEKEQGEGEEDGMSGDTDADQEQSSSSSSSGADDVLP